MSLFEIEQKFHCTNFFPINLKIYRISNREMSYDFQKSKTLEIFKKTKWISRYYSELNNVIIKIKYILLQILKVKKEKGHTHDKHI